MKNRLSKLIVVAIILLIANFTYAVQIYYSGKVTKIAENSITVDKTTYTVASDSRIAIHYMVKNAIYEKPASFKDIKAGDEVTVRIDEKNIIREILIEQSSK